MSLHSATTNSRILEFIEGMISGILFTIEVTSVTDRDDLVAEVWFGRELLAEIHYEAGQACLQVYNAPTGKSWELPLDEFQDALRQARERLGALASKDQDDSASLRERL